MLNLDNITKKATKNARILIIGGSGSGKTYALLNLINE